MAAPQAWSSHIWTEQTLTRLIGSDQQQVEICTNERMPQSFMVPRSLLNFYCPKLHPSPTLPKHPYVLETSLALLTLFFGWLYTGKVDTTSWYDLTELYFLGHNAGCVALMRSSISQLQKVCRDDQRNHTELFHYGHISVIEEMVGASSPLSRYVEDTYFNHWRPAVDDGVSDDSSKHPEATAFFKKLFERSFVEQREGEHCSCCHDYCKYHDHSEEERLATCGRSSAPVAGSSTSAPDPPTHPASDPAVQPAATPTVKPAPSRVVGSDPSKRMNRARKSVRRTTLSELASEYGDSVLHKTRATASRDGTPKVKTADDTWLTVMSRAPVGYPADYHGLLMSLPQVQSIKPPDWLESGLSAEGIDQLPEPDRIIAAAMSWNAEDYAQTKCNFFNQYDPAIRDQSRWLKILKFGGSKPKEKGERLLAMWESLGWLEAPDATANNEIQRRKGSIASNARTQTPRSAKLVESVEERNASSKRAAPAWSPQENDAMMRIMDGLEADPTHANTTTAQRAEMCRQRLKTQYGTDRTSVAILIRYHKHRRDREAVQSSENTIALDNFAAGASLPNILTNAPLTIRPLGTVFTAINDSRCDTVASDDRVDSAAPSSTTEVKKRSERWTNEEDQALSEIFKEIEEDPVQSMLNDRDRNTLCSARLLSEHDIDRSPYGVKKRWRRLNSSNNTPEKRKAEDDDEYNDESEPLMNRQKRRQTGSRFVPELYDAGEE